jgi:hypothetical protein
MARIDHETSRAQIFVCTSYLVCHRAVVGRLVSPAADHVALRVKDKNWHVAPVEHVHVVFAMEKEAK